MTLTAIGLGLALLVAATIGAVVVVLLVRLLRDHRRRGEARRQALQQIAASMELTFLDRMDAGDAIGASGSFAERDVHDPGGRHDFIQDRGLSYLTHDGGRGPVCEVFRGQREGARVTLCRHHYFDDVDSSYEQTVAAFAAPDLALPAFALARSDFQTRSWFTFQGMKNISLPGASESEPVYLLRGPDEDAIQRLFGPALVQILLRCELWNVEGRGQHLLVYRENQVLGPEEMPALLAQALEVLAAFRAAQ